MPKKTAQLKKSPPARKDSRLLRTFRPRLLRWYRGHGRKLPWRHTRDPYAILVSEVMLQQTQVPRVLAYYEKFLRRYPTVEDLAGAGTGEVRESWEGMGYYARARNLHRAAGKIMAEHRGRFPSTYREILSLPGVGRSTAGAVLSFAFHRDAPILDTNAARVLARLFGLDDDGRSALWDLARQAIPPGKAYIFNQAIMDFGALICTARAPRCPTCIFSDICRFFRS